MVAWNIKLRFCVYSVIEILKKLSQLTDKATDPKADIFRLCKMFREVEEVTELIY